MPDKNDLVDTAYQGLRVKEMGFVESVKQSIRGWANDILSFRGVVIANLITMSIGIVVYYYLSGIGAWAGVGIAIVGLFGLVSNARHIGED